MTWILELVQKSGQLVFWFVTSIIIPLTIWFTLVRSDISNLKAETLDNKVEIKDVKEKTNGKLDMIISDLGVIKGELKRIK